MSDIAPLWTEVSDLKLQVANLQNGINAQLNKIIEAHNDLSKHVVAKIKPLEDDLAARAKAEADAAAAASTHEREDLKKQIERLLAENTKLKEAQKVAAAAASVATK